MIIDYDVNSTIGHGRGYPTGLEHSEKIDVIVCLLDEGERSYVNDEHTAWICSDQCAVGEMVTLDESSTMEHTIVRKAKAGKLRFDGFNKVWESKQIGEIAEVVGGGTPKTEIVDYWDGEIKWFTPSEIGKTKYVFDSDRHITEKGLKNSSAKLLPKDALLLSSRATVGEISIALTECSTNQGFQSLITKSNVDNDFIYYLISTIKNEFLRRSSGSTFLEINKNEIKRMPINIPELSEQKKISNLFSAIDNKIEMLEKKCEYYQDFKKYLMQRIFSSSDDKLLYS